MVVLISPAQTRLKWIIKDSQDKDRDYAIECCPMILSIDKIYKRIRNLTFRRIKPGAVSLTPDEMPTYEPYVLRESISNAIAHQDYMQHGVVNVVEYEDKVVISNLGTFIPGSLKNVLSHSGPQEKYHNPFLVAAMVELKLVDTIGSGIPNICEYQKRRLFPMPVYELSDGRVELTIYGKVIDEQYAWQLSTNSSLTFLDIEMLNRVQLNRPITEDEWKYLKKKKLVSGRKERPYVVGAVEKKDNHLCLEILDLLRRNNEMSKAEIEGAIIDKLAEEMSENQKHDKITNLLKRMKKEKQIDTTGKGPSAKWFIIK